MTKTHKIIYWVSTVWLALGMLSSGIVQLLQTEMEVSFIEALGYPAYFLIILGAWKILGVAAILVPGRPLLKEWAYAGFFFTMSGAVLSHVAVGDPVTTTIPALLLTVLTVVSWKARGGERMVAPASN